MLVRPVSGAAISVGGQYAPAEVLARNGTDDNNYDDKNPYNETWVRRRVRELVALHDDPVYSFISNVEAMVGQRSLRTTQLRGDHAVNELFTGDSAGQNPDRFYHRMPGNVLDKERRAAGAALGRDVIDTQVDLHDGSAKRAASSSSSETPKRTAATGPGNYPVVGRIAQDPTTTTTATPPVRRGRRPPGMSEPEEDLPTEPPPPPPLASPAPAAAPVRRGRRIPGASDPDLPATTGDVPVPLLPTPLATPAADAPADAPPAGISASELERRRRAADPPLPHVELPAIVAPPDDPVVPPPTGNVRLKMTYAAALTNPSVRQSTIEHIPDEPGMVTALTKQPDLNVIPPGSSEPVYNGEDGDVVALRRLLSTTPMSKADLELWSRIYDNGHGTTRPAPRVGPAEVSATRQMQRIQIIDFANSISNAADLEWQLLPEHLRLLFLTPEATFALEHATWMAHYHQPWDANRPPPMGPRPVSRDRQMVPLIDLMTHEMVRTPFAALVANIILYWRHRRSADESREQASLKQINDNVAVLCTMREETNGFVSLMGHYDLPARRSRFEIEKKREAHLRKTGRHWSDLDRSVYSGAQAPGRHVAAAIHAHAAPAPVLAAVRYPNMPVAAAMRLLADDEARQRMVTAVFGRQF